jgi:hypothetical protein
MHIFVKWPPKIRCPLPPFHFSQVVDLVGWPILRHEDLSRFAATYRFFLALANLTEI